MTYWEPIATSSSHLEPPEPEPWICPECDKDEDYCDCGSCDSCDALGNTSECRSGDETLWLCDECKIEEDDNPIDRTLTITISLSGEAFADEPAQEIYRILNDAAGLIGFTGEIKDRALLDINGNTVGALTLTNGEES